MKVMVKKILRVGGTAVLLCSFSSAASPADLYKKCASCHGEDGRHKAFGRSEKIGGKSKEEILKKLLFFRSLSADATGTSKVMRKQLKNLSQKEIEELAEYISKL